MSKLILLLAAMFGFGSVAAIADPPPGGGGNQPPPHHHHHHHHPQGQPQPQPNGPH